MVQNNEDIYTIEEATCELIPINGDTSENEGESRRNTGNLVMEDIGVNFSSGTITNNIGFQSFLAITLMAIVYGVGNYVFKIMPNNIIDKKLQNM